MESMKHESPNDSSHNQSTEKSTSNNDFETQFYEEIEQVIKENEGEGANIFRGMGWL